MNDIFCSLCQSSIAPGEATSTCPECGVVYHADCHGEVGGCGNYGCSLVPAPAAQAASVPATIWGRETKTCPACAREVRAAAVRCRHCGATFGTVEAQSPEEFHQRNERSVRIQTLRRHATVLFLGGVIPFAFPLVLAVGVPVVLKNRTQIRRLPPIYRFLGAAGIGLASVWLLLSVAVLLISVT